MKSKILSHPSKMPCPAISLDARACKTGSKLAEIEGTVCHDCYALKGFYRMPNTRNAMQRRMDFMTSLEFVPKMVEELRQFCTNGYFRWFDSGDVQSVQMATNILEICRQTPEIKHWIPSKEPAIWKDALTQTEQPDNAIVRMSATKIDSAASNKWAHTSTVHKDRDPFGQACPASSQGNKCLDCRSCWDANVANVSYSFH